MQYYVRIILCPALVALIGCSLASRVCAQPFRGPWNAPAGESVLSRGMDKDEPGSPLSPLQWLVRLYQTNISPIDGKDCPMYPSCSDYSIRSFRKHGFLMGWFMTIDRLLHEADEIRRAPAVYVNGEDRLYDPLEANDFWWRSNK